MRPLRIMLGDLSYLNDGNVGNLYVPLNLGYIASYAKLLFAQDVHIRLFKDPKAMLEAVRDESPDLIGLSAYYWQEEVNKLFVRKVRAISGYSPTILMGGPCVDSDQEARDDYAVRHPGVDQFIVNEGENAFAALVGSLLGGSYDEGSRTAGSITGLTTDLASVPSPYLDGTLDEFLDGPYQPIVQTSRLCPYTCSFCVSGKSRGKLRAFPMEQVNAEIEFVAKRFADRPDLIFYIVDENFGILRRDVEVARAIRSVMDTCGYPKRVFYYNDKRFTQTSRDVHEVLGDACWHGVTLSLQSENPETLKAIRRRNLTDQEVASAISWAHGLGLTVSTELIFGLPMETRESFMALLDKCAAAGFDKVQCYNCIMFDGIEMNWKAYREEHGIVTKRRLLTNHQMMLDGEECVESEEVIVGSNTLSFLDYCQIRALNVLFHAVFVLGVQRDLFREHVQRGGSMTAVMMEFLDGGDMSEEFPGAYFEFLADLYREIRFELFDGAGEYGRRHIKIQPVFARRLAEHADGWVGEVLCQIVSRTKMEMAS